MTVVRIQTGHYGRTSGATGAYNPVLDLSEADMNHRLATELAKQVQQYPNRDLQFQFVGPDEKHGDPCDLFCSLHMDGSASAAASGPSCGYPPGSAPSARFAGMWKQARSKIPGSNPFRPDNYTAALSGYYGFAKSYSGSAPVKVVIENGFVTNNAEAQWAQMHRPAVATALLDTIRAYYNQPTPIDNKDPNMPLPAPPITVGNLAERVAILERKVERTTTEVDPRQGTYINRLQTRVDALENEFDGMIERVAALEQFAAAIRAV